MCIVLDSKLILLKLTRLEKQQQHQTQLLQQVLEALKSSSSCEPAELPENINLPVKTVAAMKEL